jgi:hypothetical protein
MTEQTIRRGLAKENVRYLLCNNLLKEFTVVDGIVIEGSRDALERLRERLTDRLAYVGFDQDYLPTLEGEMIERIIDSLYVA